MRKGLRNGSGSPWRQRRDAVLRQSLYGQGGERLVMDVNSSGGTSAIGPNDDRYFYHTNVLGHVYGLTDENGKLVEAYQYDAYGDRALVFSPGDNNDLQGSDHDDEITAGPGEDTIGGNGGKDLILAGAGKSTIDAGIGDDRISWEFGHGALNVEGGGGADVIGFAGHPTESDTFILSPDEGAVRVLGPGAAGPAVTLVEGVEFVSVDGLGGPDNILVQLLEGTVVQRISVNPSDNIDNLDLEADHVVLLGSPVNDSLLVEPIEVDIHVELTCVPAGPNEPSICEEDITAGGAMRVAGFPKAVFPEGHDPYEVIGMNFDDDWNVNAAAGDDTIDLLGITGPTSVDGGDDNDTVHVTPTGPLDFLADLTVDGAGGVNLLHQLFQPGGVSPLLALRDYRNFGTLGIEGPDGADVFNVYVAPTGPGTGHRDLFIDGGSPSNPGQGGGPANNQDQLTVYWQGLTPPPPPPGPPPSTGSPVVHDQELDRFFADYDPLHQFTIDYLDTKKATSANAYAAG